LLLVGADAHDCPDLARRQDRAVIAEACQEYGNQRGDPALASTAAANQPSFARLLRWNIVAAGMLSVEFDFVGGQWQREQCRKENSPASPGVRAAPVAGEPTRE
jgi:hypothetical protein